MSDVILQPMDALVQAIQQHRKILLGYQRRDQSLSLHTLAPVDLQFGNTAATADQLYLWAYCFAEEKAESHKFDRILRLRVL